MLGKWSVIVLSLTAAAIIGCRKVPTAERQTALPPVMNLAAPGNEKPGDETVLGRVVAVYEWEPTGERAADVWTAFAAVDSRLLTLKDEVSRTVGGARAEAEIQRIELQRVRDAHMERFTKAQARVKQARIAFNNLAASINRKEGVRAAASMITRGLDADPSAWRQHGLRGLQGRLHTH